MNGIVNLLAECLTFGNILLVAFGVFMGILVGAIPGLTATMAVAILVPFTFGMGTNAALAMLLGVFCGGVYGGSISAILMNIPGTPAAVMTSLDGNAMAKKGQGGEAIGVATISSFLGGIISCGFLILGCSFIATIAMKFSYPEYFVLAIFGLCVIADSCGSSLLKGLLAGALGILISMIGMDGLTGLSRFTFGSPNLLSGINLVPALIGLFGVSEVFNQLITLKGTKKEKQRINRILPDLHIFGRIKMIILRSSVIGTFIGALPGAGGPIAAFVAYNDAKSNSDRKDAFGTGIPEGIAAPEAANNAVTGGALIPMLALAVPGDGVTAILMSAFIIHGVQLGPMIFKNHPEVVKSVYVFLIVANVFMLVIGLLAARLFAKVIDVDNRILLPVILIICMVGSYASANSAFNILVMLAFGVIGFILQRVGVPHTAMILGIVLGSLAETNFRSALSMSQGNFAVFFRPISTFFWILGALMLLLPRVKRSLKKKKQAGHPPTAKEETT